jgi:DNA polymerase II large subunit
MATVRISVVCMECGKKFKTADVDVSCPKCGGSDIDIDYVAMKPAIFYRPAMRVSPRVA